MPDDQGLPGEVVVDAWDQTHVDLHEVGAQRDDVTEVGHAGPCVIDGDPDVCSVPSDARATAA